MKCSLPPQWLAAVVFGLAPLCASGAQAVPTPTGARPLSPLVKRIAADTAARHTAAPGTTVTPASARTAASRVRRRRHVVVVPEPSRDAGTTAESGGRVVTFHFASLGIDGAREPVLTCAVLRACVIDLEPGERLLVPAPIIGDAVRWRVGVAPAGPGGAVSIVWVKPTDCDLATNLVLPTDRRVYHLALDSGPCGGAVNMRARYISRARFTYPDDSSMHATASAPRGPMTNVSTASGGEAQLLAGIPVDALRLNFSYDLRRDRHFPWAPASVFDDGAHAFIQLPSEADAYAAPALFELDDAGRKMLLNYVVRDGFYVTDRTFRRAALVVGQGKQEQKVELANRAYGRAPGPAGRRTP